MNDDTPALDEEEGSTCALEAGSSGSESEELLEEEDELEEELSEDEISSSISSSEIGEGSPLIEAEAAAAVTGTE